MNTPSGFKVIDRHNVFPRYLIDRIATDPANTDRVGYEFFAMVQTQENLDVVLAGLHRPTCCPWHNSGGALEQSCGGDLAKCPINSQPVVTANITDLSQWEFCALAELQERINVEMVRRGTCPKCWEIFASHNDDGSCVDYAVSSISTLIDRLQEGADADTHRP